MGPEVVSSCMALFTLGCRNGLVSCGTVDVIEMAGGMLSRWYKRASVSASADDLAAGAAVAAVWNLVTQECGPKMSSASRVPLVKAYLATRNAVFGTVASEFTEDRVLAVFNDIMN